jgi:hypothetical protein
MLSKQQHKSLTVPEDKPEGKLTHKLFKRKKLIIIITGIVAIVIVSIVIMFAINGGFDETETRLAEHCYSVNSKWICPTGGV